MTAADIVTIIAGTVGPLALIGGGVKWVASRVDKLDERLKCAEKKCTKLEREHGRVLVQVQRWRTAFQIVAAELRKLDPQNHSLTIAQGMLAEKIPDFDQDDDETEAQEQLLHKLMQGADDE